MTLKKPVYYQFSPSNICVVCVKETCSLGTQWLSGRVLDSISRGCGFKPDQRHCVVVLNQDTVILA